MSSAPAPLALLSASPTSVHFRGFQLDQTYQQRVSVRNDSGKALRLQFTFPGRGGAAGAFRVAFAGDAHARKPFISAGLTEELVVSFRAPLGFQYYYDCVRVRCEQVAYASNALAALAGELDIPLHAYPAIASARDFPSRIDFGAVPIGQVARREIPLRCNVPVEFEFAVELRAAHPSFTVFPLAGVVPANGATRVEVEFRPLAYCTASAELRLLVAQLGFEPVVCTLVGSSTSTAGRDAAGDASGGRTGDGDRDPGRGGERGHDGGGSQEAHSSSPSSRSESPKRMAGGNSAPSRKSPGPRGRASDVSAGTEAVGGVEIPKDVDSVSGVTFVLNQQAGKLRPRDLKKAIAASRELRRQQELGLGEREGGDNQTGVLGFSALVRHEAETGAEGGDNNGSSSDGADESEVAIGRMRFQREVKQVEALEKALEFQSHQQSRVGAPLLSAAQVEVLEDMRAANALSRARSSRERLRRSFDTVATELEGPKAAAAAAAAGVRTATLPVALASGAALAKMAPPDFKPHKNDLWARRARALQRLVRAASTVMVRVRAQRRLERLRLWLGRAATRSDVRARVELDWEHARRGNNQLEHDQGRDDDGDDDGGEGGRDRQLYLSSAPEVERREFRSRERSQVTTVDVGLELRRFAPAGLATFFPLRERDEALVMGHAPLALPPLPTDVPLLDVEDAEPAADRLPRRTAGSRPLRTLRAGAFDEYGSALRSLSAAPASVNADTVESPMLRLSLLDLLPRDVFLRPQASVRPLAVWDRDATVSALRVRPRESDAGHALRPTPKVKAPDARTFGERRARQVGMASVSAERRWRRQPTNSVDGDGGDAPPPPSLCLSDTWLPTTTARSAGTGVDALFWSEDAPLGGRIFRDVWDVGVGRTDCGIPAFATAAEDVPPLSDSESDDESDGEAEDAAQDTDSRVRRPRRRVPTWEDALRLFEPESDEHESGGRTAFERYDRLEQQERDYCAARRAQLERLPKLLELLAERLAQIPGAPELVVEGHGPQRPLHQPEIVASAAVSVPKAKTVRG